jgi:hypothetical protein
MAPKLSSAMPMLGGAGGNMVDKEKASGWQDSNPWSEAKVSTRTTVMGGHALSSLFRRFNLHRSAWSSTWPNGSGSRQLSSPWSTTCQITPTSFAVLLKFPNYFVMNSCSAREVRDCLGDGGSLRGWDAKALGLICTYNSQCPHLATENI